MILPRVLIANRGEIAVRIIRTCRAMGIETVAVYSDFDRDSLPVQLADQAVPIGPSPARESYLNISAILEAARRSGARAIHPGYGFLAENPDFAAACEQAGLVFIGPSSSVIRALGNKSRARRLAQEAGVPVLHAGSKEEFTHLGFPILIKASAGGGGRGMRIVRNSAEFAEAFAEAASESERAFGDGTLLVEKYVEGARHVEIQIFGDHHGNLIHLNERDCSIQRRHQKIIEESPSPAVTPELRERMAAAALALARRAGYTNAGTVEFLLAPSGEFYFLEVNTRIQVEHPVTEMNTGLDLIRMQLEVAQGRQLSQPPSPAGHAIEARLYAEDPAKNFVPSTGTLHVWRLPAPTQDVRIDAGVEEGTKIGVFYDPLLAKVVAHGPDRETAIAKLRYALTHLAAQGVANNREFLIQVLNSQDFRAGRAHAGWELSASESSRESVIARDEDDAICAAVVAAYVLETERIQRKILPSIPARFRNNPYASPTMRFEIDGCEPAAGAHPPSLEVLRITAELVEALVSGLRHTFYVCRHGEDFYLRSRSGLQRKVTRMPRYPRPAGAAREAANSPMPGQVLRILVSEGQRVQPGQPLVALEAMKMEQTVKAATSGVVKSILVKTGEMVSPGQMLVEIQALEDIHDNADADSSANRSTAG